MGFTSPENLLMRLLKRFGFLRDSELEWAPREFKMAGMAPELSTVEMEVYSDRLETFDALFHQF